jgi:hypothetical protein
MRMAVYSSGSANAIHLHGHGYSASGDCEPHAQFNDNLSTLQVRSLVLGTVHSTSLGIREEMTLEKITTVARSALGESYPLPDDELSIILRAGFSAADRQNRDKLPGRNEDKIIKNIMNRRRFFTTRRDHICIGPARTQVGDKVCIIAGCNFPMVLRPEEGGFYDLVGEAYDKDSSNDEMNFANILLSSSQCYGWPSFRKT